MSGVYARNREETKMQFYANALALQKELTNYVMREKVVPKKWRFAIAHNVINKVDELVDNITYANSIFPKKEKQLELREYYQTMAICNCFQLQNKIVRMIECVETVKVEHMTEIIKKLEHEITLLKSWQKANKIIG